MPIYTFSRGSHVSRFAPDGGIGTSYGIVASPTPHTDPPPSRPARMSPAIPLACKANVGGERYAVSRCAKRDCRKCGQQALLCPRSASRSMSGSMGGRHDDCLSIPTPYIRGLTAVATVPGGAALLTSVEGSAPRLVRFAPSDGGEVTELDFGDFLAWARGMRPGYVIPHLHMIVPGGGISLDGTRWMHCRLSFFLPGSRTRRSTLG